MGIWIRETRINATESYRYGEEDPYETWCESIKDLFSAMMQDNGRCVGKMYVDTKDNGAKQVGWVFQKRQKYTDCKDTYLQETWVSVYAEQPEHVPGHYNVTAYPFS